MAPLLAPGMWPRWNCRGWLECGATIVKPLDITTAGLFERRRLAGVIPKQSERRFPLMPQQASNPGKRPARPWLAFAPTAQERHQHGQRPTARQCLNVFLAPLPRTVLQPHDEFGVPTVRDTSRQPAVIEPLRLDDVAMRSQPTAGGGELRWRAVAKDQNRRSIQHGGWLRTGSRVPVAPTIRDEAHTDTSTDTSTDTNTTVKL